MLIGRIGGISPDGMTVLYDAQTQEMVSLPLPKVEEGVEIAQDISGDWHIVYTDGMEKEKKNRLEQAEKFYYATRSFLNYKDYNYIVLRFPTNCFQKYQQNPFFLADITKEASDLPLCDVSAIDKNIVLNTFEDRLNEMKYIMRDVLTRNESMGHTWMTLEEFQKKVSAQLDRNGHHLQTGDVLPYLRYYKQEFIIVHEAEEVVVKVGFASTYYRERTIYRQVSTAMQLTTPFPRFSVGTSEFASEKQIEAVNHLICKGGRLCILTGGPGTGKTTTLRLLVNELSLQYNMPNIYLLSPTGRAAKRIQEVFGGEDVSVSTVHKFLGYGHPLTARDRARISQADLIIVDESSMLDLDIFERLLALINFNHTKLILVGDVDQLPSIGAGNILHDLISLGVYTERLTENFRSNGAIIQNAVKINEGIPFLTENEEFVIQSPPKELSDFFAGMDEDADIVITPYRVDRKLGNATVINTVAQNRIFADAPYCPNPFRVGDVVLMTHTNYHQGYFNGEVGRVVAYLPSGDYMVSFEDRTLTIKDVEDMSLGYAGTVHKSQGSEYNVINICIPEYNSFITRRMLYTAVTRAKQKVVIQSTKEILRKIILNNPEQFRNTFLSTFEKIPMAG